MNNVDNIFIMLGGITVFAGVITLLDWLGQRQQARRDSKGS